MKRCYLAFVFSLIIGMAYSQDLIPTKKNVDSLVRQLKTATHKEEIASLTTQLGMLYKSMAPDSVLFYGTTGLSLSKELGIKELEITNLVTLATHYLNNNDHDKAIHYLTEARKYCSVIANNRDCSAHISLANSYLLLLKAEYDEADKELEKAMAHYRSTKKHGSLASCMTVKGSLKLNTQLYPESLEWFLKALDVYANIDHPSGVSNSHQNIARMYLYTQDYEKAIIELQKAIDVNDLHGLEREQLSAMHIMVIALSNLNEPERALPYIHKTRELLGEKGKPILKSRNHNQYAWYYTSKNDIPKAIAHYEKSMDILNSIDAEIQEKSAITILLIDAYISDKKYGLARELLGKPEEKKGSMYISDNYLYLAKLDSIEGKFESAYTNYNKYIRIKDSIDLAHRAIEVNKLQAKYEVSEKDAQIEILKAKSERDVQKAINQRNINYSLLGVALLSLLLGIAFYSKYRTKEKLNTAISAKNSLLETTQASLQKSVEEKELLLREVHHRVKNNLQMAIGILLLQGNLEDDKKIKQFLRKGEARIQAMALIHQTLYESNNLSHVNFKDYVKSLLDHMYGAYVRNTCKISHEISIGDHSFDIQKSVSLGLIVNELVGNSFKHAFPKENAGSLYVRLQQENKDSLQLIVGDNGIGIRKNIEKKASFGMELVDLLVAQLNGSLKRVRKKTGTEFIISFKAV